MNPMATESNLTVATATTAPTTTSTVIGHWVTLIKAHEKLLLAIIVATVLFHFGNKAYDAYGNYLTHKQSEINLQISAQSATNAVLQKQLDDMAASLTAQTKIDDAKITAAKLTLATQQSADAKMSAPDLAIRIASLLTVKPQDVTAATLPDHLDLDANAAHAVANNLEQIPALQTQLSATQDKLNGCTSVLALSSQQIVGLNISIALEQKGRAEDAKVAAVNQKKAWGRGFKWGFGTGVAATVAVIVAIKAHI